MRPFEVPLLVIRSRTPLLAMRQGRGERSCHPIATQLLVTS